MDNLHILQLEFLKEEFLHIIFYLVFRLIDFDSKAQATTPTLNGLGDD